MKMPAKRVRKAEAREPPACAAGIVQNFSKQVNG